MTTKSGPLRYLWPEDNLAHPAMGGASWSFGGTVNAEYPIENLGNQDPEFPFKTLDATATITRTFFASLLVESLTLVHTNLAPGVIVHFIGTGFDESVAVPAWHEDGHPENTIVQLPTPMLTSSITVTIGNNGIGITIGEMIIGRVWRVIEFTPGVTEDETHPNIRSEGGGVSTIYEHGYRERWLRGTFQLSPQYQTQGSPNFGDGTVRSWRRAAHDDSRPFLVREGTHEPMFVLFEKPNAPRRRSWETLNDFLDNYPAEFVEAGRGLPPEP